MLLPKRDSTRRCNFSWTLRLLNPQKLFGVIGGVIITLINSRKIKLGAEKSTQTFLYKVFRQPFGSWTSAPEIVDVRAGNRGRPHQKVRFPAAPMVKRNILTLGHPGVRVRNVRGKSGPKNLCLCCFSSLIQKH